MIVIFEMAFTSKCKLKIIICSIEKVMRVHTHTHMVIPQQNTVDNFNNNNNNTSNLQIQST